MKILLLFVMFISLSCIGIFSTRFTDYIYRYSANYEDDVYYRGMFHQSSELLKRVISEIDEEDIGIVFNLDETIQGSTLTYTGNYYGNILDTGFTFSQRICCKIEHYEILSDSSDEGMNVIASSNVDSKEMNPVATFSYSFPSFAYQRFEDIGIDNIGFVLTRAVFDPDVSYNSLNSFAFKADRQTLERLGASSAFDLGSELNLSSNVAFSSISTMFYLLFSIPYVLALAFFTSLLKMTDTVTMKELVLFRMFGYSKKKAKRLFFFENSVLALIPFILSIVIFTPIYYFVVSQTLILPLFSSLFCLLFILFYFFIYGNISIGKIYKSEKL